MGDNKDQMVDLAQKQSEALLEADMAALDANSERETADAIARENLTNAHSAEATALATNNAAQYANVGQIISDIEGKINEAKMKDADAVKRENAYRYISGIGDTISGIANLVGTANGAANQNQAYNSHAVVQKAEEARKARKLEMDQLNTRLDEMRAHQREISTAGSLAEAELRAKQSREKMQLDAQQRAAAEEARRYADTQSYRAMRDARDDWHQDRVFEQGQKEAEDLNAYRKSQQEDKDKDKTKYQEFNLGEGEFVKVPQSRMNDYNIVELFDMCPDSTKNTAGKPKYDQYGNIVGYYPPTQKEMLQAINRAAQITPSIKQAIRDLSASASGAEEEDDEFAGYARP
jgi:hypothetical protein